MRWKHYILHTWDPPTSREVSGDIWLLPDDPAYKDDFIDLTIDAVGDFEHPEDLPEGIRELQKEALEKKLGPNDFWMEDKLGDMYVVVPNFDLKEFLYWASVWLKEHNLPFVEFVKGKFEEFKCNKEPGEVIARIRERCRKKSK